MLFVARKLMAVAGLLLSLCGCGLCGRIVQCKHSELHHTINFTTVGHTKYSETLYLKCKGGWTGEGTAECIQGGKWIYNFTCTARKKAVMTQHSLYGAVPEVYHELDSWAVYTFAALAIIREKAFVPLSNACCDKAQEQVVCLKLPENECMPRDKLYLKVSNAAVGTRIPIKCCDSSSSDPVVYKTCQANGSWTDDQSLICNGTFGANDSTQLHPGVIAAIVCGFFLLIVIIGLTKYFCIFRVHRAEPVSFERGTLNRNPKKSTRSNRSDSRAPSIGR